MTGQELRAWRIKRPMTQAQLASVLDPPVDQPTVARWESGARRIPPGLSQVLKYLEQEVDDQINWKRVGARILEAYWTAASMRGSGADPDAVASLMFLLDQLLADLSEDGSREAERLRHVAAVIPPAYKSKSCG